MTFLSACNATIERDYEPSLKPTLIQLPVPPVERDYQQALTMCIIERKVLYKDIMRIARTERALNRRWWQFWK